MLYTIRLTDGHAGILNTLLGLSLQTVADCDVPLGAEAKMALDSFAVQTGQNPQWHPIDHPELRPKGE